MTITEFYNKYCSLCGSFHCPRSKEAISTCGWYEGNIEGIEKKESLSELLKKIKRERVDNHEHIYRF